jgi:mono/diheme cytochrome c family protein
MLASNRDRPPLSSLSVHRHARRRHDIWHVGQLFIQLGLALAVGNSGTATLVRPELRRSHGANLSNRVGGKPEESGSGAGDGERSMYRIPPKLPLLGCALGVFGSTAFAADADHGKTIVNRWCSSCHLVQRDQRLASDQAPPFATLAKIPDFNANKLAFLLLSPHPNMPSLSLSRAEIADIADYIATLK